MNSKLYNQIVHTELLYPAIMRRQGFAGVTVENIRKRSSKKELFEFVVRGKYEKGRDQPVSASGTDPFLDRFTGTILRANLCRLA